MLNRTYKEDMSVTFGRYFILLIDMDKVAANNYVRIKNIAINNPTESLKKFLNGKIEYLGKVKRQRGSYLY